VYGNPHRVPRYLLTSEGELLDTDHIKPLLSYHLLFASRELWVRHTLLTFSFLMCLATVYGLPVFFNQLVL
jgi:hypothetical protein